MADDKKLRYAWSFSVLRSANLGGGCEETAFRLQATVYTRQLGCGSEAVVLRRQSQVRQLKDTWPVERFCIYKYQLASRVDDQ
jgi:hypothetical protein